MQTLLKIVLLILLVLTLMPVIVTIILSLKPDVDYYNGKSIWTLTLIPQWSNYSIALGEIIPSMINTLFIDIVSTSAMIFISAYVAYIFVRHEFSGKKTLFYLIILPMLVPGIVSLTPQYLVMVNLNLLGSRWSLILPYVAGNQIASIFLFRTFMGQQPKDIYESAELDGAGNFIMYFRICLPLSLAIIMVQSVAIFAAIYNDYLWPLMMFVGNEDRSTLMPRLKDLASSVSDVHPGAAYALYLLSGIPLVITTVISLKFFINGEFASGLKL